MGRVYQKIPKLLPHNVYPEEPKMPTLRLSSESMLGLPIEMVNTIERSEHAARVFATKLYIKNFEKLKMSPFGRKYRKMKKRQKINDTEKIYVSPTQVYAFYMKNGIELKVNKTSYETWRQQ